LPWHGKRPRASCRYYGGISHCGQRGTTSHASWSSFPAHRIARI